VHKKISISPAIISFKQTLKKGISFMKIWLNNNSEEFDDEKITISDILEIKKFTFKIIIVKVNEKVIRREDYSETIVRDGDNLLILHLMSGG
jgi:sulfur carrier protein